MSSTSPTARSNDRSRSPLPERVDVAIVGAGLGGLVAAANLARAGLQVACFDAHYVAGGCATQFRRRSGDGFYHFDVGLHYIGDCGESGAIPSILRELEIEIDYVPLDPDGFDNLVFPDFTFAIPSDLDRYRDRLVAYFPTEVRGIDRYVRFLREVRTVGQKMDSGAGRSALSMIATIAKHGRLLARYRDASIQHVLDDCTKNPRLQAVMLGQSGDYGLPPSEVSALLHAGLAQHYFQGAYYPRGGGQIIADKVADAIEAAGGSVHLRKPIERILIEGGRAVGVRIEAGRREPAVEVRADVVISNADIKRTYLELVGPEYLTAASVRKARSWTMGGAIFMTVAGIRGDLRELGMKNANYWVFDDYDLESFYRDSRDANAPTPRGCYITSASLKDPDTPHHAPEGCQTIEIMTLVPGQADAWGVSTDDITPWNYKGREDYVALKERLHNEMLERLESLFPGALAQLDFAESATPVSHSRFTRASDGTGYGLACTPAQFMQGRPGYRAEIPGLYLCGASTRAGHGIVGAMMSGRHAARRVLHDRGLATPES